MKIKMSPNLLAGTQRKISLLVFIYYNLTYKYTYIHTNTHTKLQSQVTENLIEQ